MVTAKKPKAKAGTSLALVKKRLHPNRFPGMSGKMAAIVAYIIGEHWTDPEIVDLNVTSDGFVMNYNSDYSDGFLGSYADLHRNWVNLLNVAFKPDEENLKKQADALFMRKVHKRMR